MTEKLRWGAFSCIIAGHQCFCKLHAVADLRKALNSRGGFDSLHPLQLFIKLEPTAITSYNDYSFAYMRHCPPYDKNVTDGLRQNSQKTVLEVVRKDAQSQRRQSPLIFSPCASFTAACTSSFRKPQTQQSSFLSNDLSLAACLKHFVSRPIEFWIWFFHLNCNKGLALFHRTKPTE